MPEQLVEHGAVDLGAPDRALERQQQPADAHQVLVALGEVVVEEVRENGVLSSVVIVAALAPDGLAASASRFARPSSEHLRRERLGQILRGAGRQRASRGSTRRRASSARRPARRGSA